MCNSAVTLTFIAWSTLYVYSTCCLVYIRVKKCTHI